MGTLAGTAKDDPAQARLAKKTMQSAELLAISVAVLCEFVWVLR
jgi:hypothetical protein